MMSKLPTKAIIVGLLVAIAIPSIAEARRFGFLSWFRQTAAPVPDGTVFDPVDVTKSNLYCVSIGGRSFFQIDNVVFEDTTTTAGVVDGEFRSRSIRTSDGGEFQILVELEYAQLRQSAFGNQIIAPGTATYYDPSVQQRFEMDVVFVGRITESNGGYALRGKVVGLSWDLAGRQLDVKLLTQCLSGFGEEPITRPPAIVR